MPLLGACMGHDFFRENQEKEVDACLYAKITWVRSSHHILLDREARGIQVRRT
jgi:hypothetical protein